MSLQQNIRCSEVCGEGTTDKSFREKNHIKWLGNTSAY